MTYKVINKTEIIDNNITFYVYKNYNPYKIETFTYKYKLTEIFDSLEKQIEFFTMLMDCEINFNHKDNSDLCYAFLNTCDKIKENNHHRVFINEELLRQYTEMFIEALKLKQPIPLGYIKIDDTYVTKIKEIGRNTHDIQYHLKRKKIFTYNQFLLLKLQDYRVEFINL